MGQDQKPKPDWSTGYANAPPYVWNSSEDATGAAEPSWRSGTSSPPPSYRAVDPAAPGGPLKGRANLAPIYEDRTPEDIRQQKQRPKPQAGTCLLFYGGWLFFFACEVVAAVLTGLGNKELSGFRTTNPNLRFAMLMTMIAVMLEVGLAFFTVPCLWSCMGGNWMMRYTALVVVEAFGTGAYLIYAIKFGMDNGVCDDGPSGRVNFCRAGLEMGMTAGVFRLFLLPTGIMIWFAHRKQQKAKEATKNTSAQGGEEGGEVLSPRGEAVGAV